MHKCTTTHKLLFSAHKYKQLIAQNDELKYNDEVSEIKFIIRFLLSISLRLAKSNSVCICIGILQLKMHIYTSGFVYTFVCALDTCIARWFHLFKSNESLFRWRELRWRDREIKPFEQSTVKRVSEEDKGEEEKYTTNQIKRNRNEWYTQITSIENDQLRESLIKFFFPFYSLDSKILYHSHINVQLFQFVLVYLFFVIFNSGDLCGRVKVTLKIKTEARFSIFLSHLTNEWMKNSVNEGRHVKCSTL